MLSPQVYGNQIFHPLENLFQGKVSAMSHLYRENFLATNAGPGCKTEVLVGLGESQSLSSPRLMSL